MRNRLFIVTFVSIISFLGIAIICPKAVAFDYNTYKAVLNCDAGPQSINQSNRVVIEDHSGEAETIDPLTGSLSYSERDLTLPGKNGFDFVLGRNYNSSMGNFATKQSDFMIVPNNGQQLWYADISSTDQGTVILGPYTNQSEAENSAAWFLYNNPNYNANNVSIYWQIQPSTNEYVIQYFSMNMPNNFLKSRWDLGAGWAFSFPTIESVFSSETFMETRYFHCENGVTYRINYTSDPDDSNLVGYQDKDVKIVQENGTFETQEYTSVFTNREQKKYYFAANGCLIGIQDRFGNKMKFTYIDRQIMVGSNSVTYPYISDIIDSMGRTIHFSYQSSNDYGADTITVTVNDPSTSKTITIVYTKQKFAYDDPGVWVPDDSIGPGRNPSTRPEPYLASVTNPKGEIEVNYEYYFPYSSFSYSARNLDYDTSYDRYALLHTANYSEHRTVFEYSGIRRILASGCFDDFQVSRRFDQNMINGSYSGNHVYHQEYSYFGDYNTCYFNNYGTYASHSQADWTGVYNTYIYDSRGRVESIYHTKDGCTKLTENLRFDAVFSGKPTMIKYSETSSGGTNTLYRDLTYNSWGGIATETNPLTIEQRNDSSVKTLHTTTYTYDPLYHQITSTQQYKDASTLLTESISYDSLGRPLQTTDANGNVISYSYPEDGITIITKDTGEGKTAQTVITCGAETRKAFPTEIRQSYTGAGGNSQSISTKAYDLLTGLVTSSTDSQGNQTSYLYDELGRLVLTRLPNINGCEVEQQTSYQRSASSDVLNYGNTGMNTTLVENRTVYRSGGQEQEFSHHKTYYNAYGKPVLDIFRDDQSGAWKFNFQYWWEPGMRLDAVQDANGGFTFYKWDAWDRLIQQKDQFNIVHNAEYDDYARTMRTYIQPENGARQNEVMTYNDQWGRVIRKTALPSGISELYSYDLADNLISYTDPKSQVYTFNNDNLGQLTRVTDPLSQQSEYGYNKLGNLTSLTVEKGAESYTTTKQYDEMGHQLSRTLPGSLTDTFAYDNMGRVISSTDPNSNHFAMTYDNQGRLLTRNTPEKTYSNQYGNNPYGPQSISVSDGSSISYTYGDQGRVVSMQVNDNGKTGGTAYQYDAAGNLTGMIDSFQNGISYGYDKGRVANVQMPCGNVYYEYEADNKIKRIAYPALTNGKVVRTTFEYDDLRRLKKMSNLLDSEVLSQYEYSYDNNNNIITVQDAKGISHYYYDELNRLAKSVRYDGQTTQFSYDLRGNRLTGKDAPVVDETGTQYSFNSMNQLASSTRGDVTTSYRYDPTGLRTSKSSPASGKRYIYNQAGKVVAEADGNNQFQAAYFWGPDRMLIKKDSNGQYYLFLYNGHGDVVQILDASGRVMNEYEYDEWGSVLSQNETIANDFKYAGEMQDSETGLYYLRARYYDPTLGRFISKDSYEGSITNPLSLNLYTYVQNNPLIYVDPTGHETEWDRNHVKNKKDLKTIKDAGEVWKNAKNDDERTAAHNLAEGIRNKYRTSMEVGLPNGETVSEGCKQDPVVNTAIGVVAGLGAGGIYNGISSCVEGAISNGAETTLVNSIETQASIKATQHGAERLSERGFSILDYEITKSTDTIMTQSDGATVFIKEISPGRFNVIVEGQNGVITALKNISQKSLERLSKNYGWGE